MVINVCACVLGWGGGGVMLCGHKGNSADVFGGGVTWLYDTVTEACTVLYTMLLCQGFKWGPTDSVGLGGV